MAQLVEHILGKDEVISSNLISSSNPTDQVGFLVCMGILETGKADGKPSAFWLYRSVCYKIRKQFGCADVCGQKIRATGDFNLLR